MKRFLLIVIVVTLVLVFFPQVRSWFALNVFSSPLVSEIREKITSSAMSLYENFLVSPARAVIEKVKAQIDQIVTAKIHALFGRDGAKTK